MTYSMIVGKYKLIFSDTHFKDFRKKPTISVYDADTNSETKIASFNSQETFEWFVEAVVKADHKTENSSEKPNNSTRSKMEQVEDEPQTENLLTDKYGDVWEWRGDAWYCISGDEPQTETEIAKAIVHKMIDDAVIAEDAYPDLRQKMHDAVDEYEPLTDTDLKEVCREEDDEFTDRLIEEQLANKLLTDCAWKKGE